MRKKETRLTGRKHIRDNRLLYDLPLASWAPLTNFTQGCLRSTNIHGLRCVAGLACASVDSVC
jgi:hypothetical protein